MASHAPSSARRTHLFVRLVQAELCFDDVARQDGDTMVENRRLCIRTVIPECWATSRLAATWEYGRPRLGGYVPKPKREAFLTGMKVCG